MLQVCMDSLFIERYIVSPGVQNEKLHLLVEREKRKIRTLEEEHTMELSEWRERLACRKEVPYIHSIETRDTDTNTENRHKQRTDTHSCTQTHSHTNSHTHAHAKTHKHIRICKYFYFVQIFRLKIH